MARRGAAAPKTVDDYIARVSPPFQDALHTLRATIRRAAPGADEVISYGMPAFRQDGMLVYYAAFKDHCSLFVGSQRTRERFARELKPFDAGKGTLHFTPEEPLPADLVRRLVRARVAENAERRAR